MKRRYFIKLGTGAMLSTVGMGALTACSSTPSIRRKKSNQPRAVVVGGGTGGISVAQAIKKTDPSIEVIMIERNAKYTTCYGSNWTFNDLVTMDDITFDYKKMSKKHNITVLKGEVTNVDAEKKQVRLEDGSAIEYDRLVVSPGVSFRWDLIEGLDETTTSIIPHAWKAGKQTEILRKQIQAMPDGGTFVMSAPPNPFRCPPGPYERASLIADYFKKHKPKAKIIILDAKNTHSKQAKFQQGWSKHYGFGTDNSMIEWVSEFDGGAVKSIDAKKKIVTTVEGEKIKADVINYIPTQKANVTADKLGLVDQSFWCTIDPETFESKMIENIHVLGDASTTGMAKSAFAANSQSKVCGAAVANLLTGKEVNQTPGLFNQCFSLITPTHGISVLDAFMVNNHVVERTGGGIFPKDGKYAREADSARMWYDNITGELFN